MNKGILYLIPAPLSETSILEAVLPDEVRKTIRSLDHFIVENEKTARHFLKSAGTNKPLQELQLFPLNEHTEPSIVSDYIKPLLNGISMGLLSEAGCPGVADPGAEIAHLAHKKNIQIVPFVGPSSILLALMGSGFNGQNFSFLGYLPRDRHERVQKIKEIEKRCFRHTQIFIEAPYRNAHLFEDILSTLDVNTEICLATDLTGKDEFIFSAAVGQWIKRKQEVSDRIHKTPTIFLIYKR